MQPTILLEAIGVIVEIKNFINNYPNATFIIGKTDDCSRRKQEYKGNGYGYFKQIAKSQSLDDINELEKFLIKFSKVFYQDKIENQNDGGGGNFSESPNYFVYLTSKQDNYEHN